MKKSVRRILSLSVLAYSMLSAETLEVCKSGCEFSSLQEAIDTARDGDTVFLKQGIYRTGLVFDGKCVSVKGEGRDKTIIMPQDTNGIVYKNIGSCTLSISDLRIKGGQGTNGGGIHISLGPRRKNDAISINNVDIIGSSAVQNGGGIYIYSKYDIVLPAHTNLSIENSRIEGNSAGQNGGGIYISSNINAKIKSSIVSGNDAVKGGGVYRQDSYKNLSLENVLIDSNHAISTGGGMFIQGNGSIDKSWITNNTVQGNGGGMYLVWKNKDHQRSFVLSNTIIAKNNAEEGGGVYFTGFNTSSTVKNCTIVANKSPRNDDFIVVSSPFSVNYSKLPAEKIIKLKSFNSIFGYLRFLKNNDKFRIDFVLKNNIFKKITQDIESDVIGNNTLLEGGYGYKNIDKFDFSLMDNSPLIDKADESTATFEDITSQPRDEHPDIGAVEYPHNGDINKFKANLFDAKPLISDCSNGSQEEYQKGFEAGKLFCQQNPEKCGIKIKKESQEFDDMTPKQVVIDAIKNKSFPLSGYYIHYGQGPFDWIYVNKSLSLVAKLEKGCNAKDGSLRWNFIQTSKNNPVFESIELQDGNIKFGNKIEVPGGE